MVAEKVKLVIDTDGVSDDIRALCLALQHPNAEVLAVCTVHGCASAKQAAANVARTFRANSVDRKIPIYKGCEEPLIRKETNEDISYFFGQDGIGDQPNAFPEVLPTDSYCWEDEHAALALIRLTKEHPDIVLVCIGPLTNIAIALKLDPDFAKRPKKVVVMGGNYYATGNVVSNCSAEYNFYGDPEAASIVLEEMVSPLTVVPWEAFSIEGRKHEKEVDFYAHLHLDTPLARYLTVTTSKGRRELEKSNRQYSYCDEIAVATAIEPEQVIKEHLNLRVYLELAGKHTRGQVQVDWVDQFWTHEDNEKVVMRKRKTVQFVTAYNVHHVNNMIINAVKNSK